MTAIQTSETNNKVVRTVREFCQKNRETGAWPSSEYAVRAIVQQGEQSPFAPAILRYNRRVLIDQVEWDACLVRLAQPQTNMPIKEVEDAQMSRKTRSDHAQPS
jgi:hypothetical protein